MTVEEIEAFFLNHNDPWLEKIQECKTEGASERIAGMALDEVGKKYDKSTLLAAVRNIRSS